MAGPSPVSVAWILLAVFTLQVPLPVTSDCDVPRHLQGNFFSLQSGEDVETTIDLKTLSDKSFNGDCVTREDDHTAVDAENRHDSRILFADKTSKCYKCYELRFRTPNVVQYKFTSCETPQNNINPTFEFVCGKINPLSDYYTFFRTSYEIVNCKNTFEGIYNFSYEWNYGGGGICESAESLIEACQEPGSQYVDNQIFDMSFGKCPDVSTSEKKKIRFFCLGTWQDDQGRIWSAVQDIGEEVLKERFRCMLTTTGQEEGDNKIRYTMSWWADCAELKSEYEGPLRLLMQPVVREAVLQATPPECNFHTNYTGSWFHAGEWDVDVNINATHLYFKTKIDEFNYKESYFVCLMNSGTRFLTLAVTVGKCEIDYVCFDMLPRHHSIIRWRMSKPYRLGEVEQALPNAKLYMFNQACSWYSFTLDREKTDWNYKTFLMNPPDPIDCPIRGRYRFEQHGPATEMIQTRIRGGMTEYPRHTIDCYEYTHLWESCDTNPSKISLDAEYCETVDHTGRPVGEYDMPDWELTCVGYWSEDWVSYMITWDPEDPTSAFRCWAYERDDWRYISVSRATSAFCRPVQTPRSERPEEGASFAMRLIEHERLFDDCSQDYKSGNPWSEDVHYMASMRASGATPLLTTRNYASIAALCVFLCSIC